MKIHIVDKDAFVQIHGYLNGPACPALHLFLTGTQIPKRKDRVRLVHDKVITE